MKLPATHASAAAILLSGVAQSTAEPVRRDAMVNAAPATTSQRSLIDLFDRWELVWNEDQMGLFDSCVGDTYTRHDENGDNTVTKAAYAVTMKEIKTERPGIKVIVYDHGFVGDRAWFRFVFKWTDKKSGQKLSRAGMQSYRIAGGKLAETWIAMQPPGSEWHDKPQANWTSPPVER